ncbi:MAG: 50S ribosomal protein L22 [Candidatus Berkelbacteria bacterium]|nr:MAG: 50S ribosomal protein L22 [Candidatus Berkelbacteria bacterium]QQG52097.1 MAG: 50S ribosomal protein L22 [Candidatus Berkelbacteria bacterium]
MTVKLRFLRHSARKLRPIVLLVRGKSLTDALNTTSVMPQHSAYDINKALKMAEAAAKQKQFDPAKMIVSAITATDGPKIRRQRPNARGRSNRYLKHLAHLVITVAETENETPKTKKKTSKAVKKEETE